MKKYICIAATLFGFMALTSCEKAAEEIINLTTGVNNFTEETALINKDTGEDVTNSIIYPKVGNVLNLYLGKVSTHREEVYTGIKWESSNPEVASLEVTEKTGGSNKLTIWKQGTVTITITDFMNETIKVTIESKPAEFERDMAIICATPKGLSALYDDSDNNNYLVGDTLRLYIGHYWREAHESFNCFWAKWSISNTSVAQLLSNEGSEVKLVFTTVGTTILSVKDQMGNVKKVSLTGYKNTMVFASDAVIWDETNTKQVFNSASGYEVDKDYKFYVASTSSQSHGLYPKTIWSISDNTIATLTNANQETCIVKFKKSGIIRLKATDEKGNNLTVSLTSPEAFEPNTYICYRTSNGIANSLNNGTVRLKVGEKYTFYMGDVNANFISYPKTHWGSSNSSILKFSADTGAETEVTVLKYTDSYLQLNATDEAGNMQHVIVYINK